jgi:hypothetical protein
MMVFLRHRKRRQQASSAASVEAHDGLAPRAARPLVTLGQAFQFFNRGMTSTLIKG